jgi:hypothetical protein
VEFVRDMGVRHVCRTLARRLDLRGGITGATLPVGEADTGISGIGQVGGGVGAEMESRVVIPGLTRVQFLCCLDRVR